MSGGFDSRVGRDLVRLRAIGHDADQNFVAVLNQMLQIDRTNRFDGEREEGERGEGGIKREGEEERVREIERENDFCHEAK